MLAHTAQEEHPQLEQSEPLEQPQELQVQGDILMFKREETISSFGWLAGFWIDQLCL